MEKPVRVNKYGHDVWETPGMDMLRREHCMCLHCAKLKPNQPDNCEIAGSFFKICQRTGCAHILTRCPEWEPKD